MDTATHSRSDGADDTLPALEEWGERLGVALTDKQVDAFRLYRRELLEWSAARANLTAITDPAEVESRLFLESLWCRAALPFTDGARLIDVGSGGGFPGLPLAIAFPEMEVTLLEATRKKVDFLERVIALVGLTNCRAIHGRAEDIAHDPAQRETYDAATARALAALPVVIELCLPFVAVGGVLIAPRGESAADELNDSANALTALGGESAGIILPEPGAPITVGHKLVVISKTDSTSDAYPRRAGVPARRPL